MQAPKYGTSKNSFSAPFTVSRGTTYPGILTAEPSRPPTVGALSSATRYSFISFQARGSLSLAMPAARARNFSAGSQPVGTSSSHLRSRNEVAGMVRGVAGEDAADAAWAPPAMLAKASPMTAMRHTPSVEETGLVNIFQILGERPSASDKR